MSPAGVVYHAPLIVARDGARIDDYLLDVHAHGSIRWELVKQLRARVFKLFFYWHARARVVGSGVGPLVPQQAGQGQDGQSTRQPYDSGDRA